MPVTLAPAPETSALDPFKAFLESDNAVLRCAAMRALRRQLHVAPDAVRQACLKALMDPDPDLRSDAMEVLGHVVMPQDADVIRFSLAEDPVREVKVAAVGILATLKDRGAEELLRSLTLSRSEDLVVWEDEDSDWEDWLDVQIAAIRALGNMQATHVIEDLLAARSDEFGQSLDIAVFTALCDMGPDGVATLIRVLQAEQGTARLRAAKALAGVAPDALAEHLDTLIAAPETSLRHMAIDAMAPDDPRGAILAESDPASDVRAAALRRFAGHRAELVLGGLADPAEDVRSAALDALPGDTDPDFSVAVVENMLAWLPGAGADLGRTIARHLARLAPARALEPVRAVIEDTDRPLDLRVAAVRALDSMVPPCASAQFRDLLANPAQQVRAASVTVLTARARSGDDLARQTLCAAISGSVLSAEEAVVDRGDDAETPDMGTPKEGAGPRRITITREGDIVENAEEAEADATQSTLSSILKESLPESPELAEDTPEENLSKRRKRRPVEGPDTLARSLALETLRIAGHICHPDIVRAVIGQMQDSAPEFRRAVWTALEHQENDAALCDLARPALEADDPVVRFAAFKILMQDPDAETITRALSDQDALIRAFALSFVSAETALDHLGDDVSVVRKAAAARILDTQDAASICAAMDQLMAYERTDGLAGVMAASGVAVEYALSLLPQSVDRPRRAFVLLEGMAGSCAR